MTDTPEQRPTETSRLARLQVLHELVAGYRSLAYKILLAHAAATGAAAFVIAKPSEFPALSRVRIAAFLLTALVEWWLFMLMQRSDRNTSAAMEQWEALYVGDRQVTSDAADKFNWRSTVNRLWAPVLAAPLIFWLCLCLL